MKYSIVNTLNLDIDLLIIFFSCFQFQVCLKQSIKRKLESIKSTLLCFMTWFFLCVTETVFLSCWNSFSIFSNKKSTPPTINWWATRTDMYHGMTASLNNKFKLTNKIRIVSSIHVWIWTHKLLWNNKVVFWTRTVIFRRIAPK